MAFPFVPFSIMGGTAYITSAWMNNSAMKDPYFIPRFGGGQTDARWWGIGAGVLGLLMGPAMPFLGALGVGAGLASLINWNTMSNVEQGVQSFVAQQAITAGPQRQIPGGAGIPAAAAAFIAPLVAEAISPV